MGPARRPFIWDARCRTPLATYPGGWPGNGLGSPPRRPYSVLLPVGFTVPSPLPGPRWALTPPFHPYPRMRGRFAFCGTFPEVALAGRYPAPCFRGARTFLPGDLSVPAGAAVRPAGAIRLKQKRAGGKSGAREGA